MFIIIVVICIMQYYYDGLAYLAGTIVILK